MPEYCVEAVESGEIARNLAARASSTVRNPGQRVIGLRPGLLDWQRDSLEPPSDGFMLGEPDTLTTKLSSTR